MIRMVHPVRRPTGMMVLGCVLLVSAMPAARKSPADELRSEGPDAKTARLVDYNREVRPILSKNCFACHGSDEAKRVKGLRLDQREVAVKPLKSGEAAIVPGDPEASNLIAGQRRGRHRAHAAQEGGQSPEPCGGRCPDTLGPARSELCRALGIDPAKGGNLTESQGRCLAAE